MRSGRIVSGETGQRETMYQFRHSVLSPLTDPVASLEFGDETNPGNQPREGPSLCLC